jgi:predicted nucleic acid-binding protein
MRRPSTSASLDSDVRRGFLQVEPLVDDQAVVAADFIEGLVEHPLRTLDALHLAVARASGFSRRPIAPSPVQQKRSASRPSRLAEPGG